MKWIRLETSRLLPWRHCISDMLACLLLLLSRATPATVPANFTLSASNHRGQTLWNTAVSQCQNGIAEMVNRWQTYGNVFFQILWDVWSRLWNLTSVITREDRQVSCLHPQCSSTGASKEARKYSLILFKDFFFLKIMWTALPSYTYVHLMPVEI